MMTIFRAIAKEDSWAVSRHDGYWYLYGPDCHVPTRGQWEAMKERIDTYYALTSDEEIDRINQEADVALQRHYAEHEEPEPARATPTLTPGYIYLIHGENTPWYKIGISKAPLRRLKQLGAKSPFKLQITATFKVPDMCSAEAEWHELFEFQRAEGEWFELTENDVALFVSERGQIGVHG